MHRMVIVVSLTALLALAGCTLTEWGNIATDTGGLFDGTPAPPLPDGTAEPNGWGLLNWTTGGSAGTIVAAVAWLFRRSLARGFGRAVTATKGLLGK